MTPWAPCCNSVQLKNSSNMLDKHCSAGLEKKLAEIASKRSMDDLTVGPVLTWSTEAMLGHVDKLLKIPGGSSFEILSIITPISYTLSLPAIFRPGAQWRSKLTSYSK